MDVAMSATGGTRARSSDNHMRMSLQSLIFRGTRARCEWWIQWGGRGVSVDEWGWNPRVEGSSLVGVFAEEAAVL